MLEPMFAQHHFVVTSKNENTSKLFRRQKVYMSHVTTFLERSKLCRMFQHFPDDKNENENEPFSICDGFGDFHYRQTLRQTNNRGSVTDHDKWFRLGVGASIKPFRMFHDDEGSM